MKNNHRLCTTAIAIAALVVPFNVSTSFAQFADVVTSTSSTTTTTTVSSTTTSSSSSTSSTSSTSVTSTTMPVAFNGCTPGYWKNHLVPWGPTGFTPEDSFNATFGIAAFNPDLTLLQAAKQGGGGVKALGRHAVAALLNAAHPDVDYASGVALVITAVHNAIASGDATNIENVKNVLADLNETGCPLNARGDANGDGAVTASDALLALWAAVGSWDCPDGSCDVSGNNNGVDASDALAILKGALESK